MRFSPQVHFFDIRTSKSAAKTTVFQHFHCFSPQRRFKKCPKDYSFSTLSLPNLLHSFRHQNFKKCSEDFSFLTFSLPNVLFVTQRRAIFRHQNFKKFSEDYSFSTFSLPNVLFATAACNFSTSELQKVLRHRQFFNIFTSECAFRHSGVQFFDIRTSKSAPKTTVFQHFHIQMCFSPQRHAIFRHQNFKKCSDTVSFSAFSLPNVLFATAACNFFLDIRTSKSAPTPSVFEHFHFQMCFSPQRRAIFDVSSQHLPPHPPL